MKVFSVIILSLTLYLTVVPCCAEDAGCENESHTEQTSEQGEENHEAPCSPFYTCNGCPGFQVNASSIEINTMQVAISPQKTLRNAGDITAGYLSFLLKPPRLV